MMRVKKNDTVMVITGKDKNKKGTVIDIAPSEGKVKVKGVAVMTKHVKARKQGQASGIKKQENFIQLSNVMPICSSCSKPTRVKAKVLDDGKKVRVCTHCHEAM